MAEITDNDLKVKCFFCKTNIKNEIQILNVKNVKVSACKICSTTNEKGSAMKHRHIYLKSGVCDKTDKFNAGMSRKVKCFFCKFEIKGKSKILNFRNQKVNACPACNSTKLKLCAKKYRLKFLNCSICDKAVKSNNSILCHMCDCWTHQNCSGLSKAEINCIEKSIDTWICKNCNSDMLPFSLLSQS